MIPQIFAKAREFPNPKNDVRGIWFKSGLLYAANYKNIISYTSSSYLQNIPY